MSDNAIYCKALCDVKFSKIEENGRKFSHIELSILEQCSSLYTKNHQKRHNARPTYCKVQTLLPAFSQ